MTWKITRRKFLLTSTLAAGHLAIGAPCLSPDKKLRFGLTTDSHYANRQPSGTRYYKQSLSKMKEFVDVMNSEKVDFVIHLGDFKDEDENKRAEDTLAYLTQIEQVYGQFNGPRFHCIGNHDVDSITKQQFLSVVENTGVAKDSSYYTFESNGFLGVVLDANFHKDGRDHFYAEGANWQETFIPQKQLDWLDKTLSQNTGKPVLVFCHHPLFEYQTSSVYHVGNYAAVQQILEKYNTLAVFQGHVHQEKYSTKNGINYITQLGMVDYEGLDNNSFAIVEVDDTSLTLNGYKRTNNKKYTLK